MTVIPDTLIDDFDLAVLYGTSANMSLVKATDLGRLAMWIGNALADPIKVGAGPLDTVSVTPTVWTDVPAGREFLTTGPFPFYVYVPTTGGHSAGDAAGFVRVRVVQTA